MNLNLTGQQAVYNTVAPKINTFKQAMNLRKVMWYKIPLAKKKSWVQWDKDPIMGLAAQVIEYFVKNFPDLVTYYIEKHNDT